jgi:hypothetical protein
MTRSQPTLAGAGFEKYTKVTRRAQFLAEMDRVVPWRELCARIEPVYPKPGNGRPPVALERMLRMYFLQHRFNLSDPAVEEALYDSLANLFMMRKRFSGPPRPLKPLVRVRSSGLTAKVHHGKFFDRELTVHPSV